MVTDSCLWMTHLYACGRFVIHHKNVWFDIQKNFDQPIEIPSMFFFLLFFFFLFFLFFFFVFFFLFCFFFFQTAVFHFLWVGTWGVKQRGICNHWLISHHLPNEFC